jgi:hypothetical protein
MRWVMRDHARMNSRTAHRVIAGWSFLAASAFLAVALSTADHRRLAVGGTALAGVTAIRYGRRASVAAAAKQHESRSVAR